MADEKHMRMATSRLRGFRSHVSGSVTEAMVSEYHSIVSEVEEASGQHLASFRISPDVMVQREISDIRKRRVVDRSIPQFTVNKYCDKELFSRALDALWEWIEERDALLRLAQH
jgi:hypothetical protein